MRKPLAIDILGIKLFIPSSYFWRSNLFKVLRYETGEYISVKIFREEGEEVAYERFQTTLMDMSRTLNIRNFIFVVGFWIS